MLKLKEQNKKTSGNNYKTGPNFRTTSVMKHDEPRLKYSKTTRFSQRIQGFIFRTTKTEKINGKTTLNVAYLLYMGMPSHRSHPVTLTTRIVFFLGWVNPVTLPCAAAEHPKLYQWWLVPPKIKLAWTLWNWWSEPNKITFPQYPNYELLQAGWS